MKPKESSRKNKKWKKKPSGVEYEEGNYQRSENVSEIEVDTENANSDVEILRSKSNPWPKAKQWLYSERSENRFAGAALN